MTDQPLFAGYETPDIEDLSADRRRTLKQHADVDRGIHPLMRTPLHQDAPTDTKPTDGRRPFTCGACVHRITWGAHSFPKCDIGPIAHSASTDVRAWWPGCPSYEAR